MFIRDQAASELSLSFLDAFFASIDPDLDMYYVGDAIGAYCAI